MTPIRAMPFMLALGCTAAITLPAANAQTPANMAALQGLSPVSALAGTVSGRDALAANLAITGMIQTGTANQPTLLAFASQQQQALRDAFITGGNASELADGLGSRLGSVCQQEARYNSARDYTNVSPAIADLVAYTNATTASDSNMAKYFFANGTTDGTAPVSVAATAILGRLGGVIDVFGKAYGFPAGSAGADAFGNSRPFQTQHTVALYDGPDYFGQASRNTAYLRGPSQDKDVRMVAPEAGYLLTATFPFLTLDQADMILTSTEGPGGGFLDDGSAFGLYSRLDLYAAVKKAMSLAPGERKPLRVRVRTAAVPTDEGERVHAGICVVPPSNVCVTGLPTTWSRLGGAHLLSQPQGGT